MLNDRQLLFAANEVRCEVVDRFPEYGQRLSTTQILIWGMSASAGRAWPQRNLIKLSRSFFACEENFNREFREVVLHELAHVIAPPRAGHNHIWREIALKIGSNGEVCHSMSLATGFKKRQKRMYWLKCNCGERRYLARGTNLEVTLPTYRQLNPNCGYQCQTCKSFLEYVSTEWI